MIKTWHLVLLLLIVVIGTNIIEMVQINKVEDGSDFFKLEELQADRFHTTVMSGTSCVLFYSDESDLCKKMESNLGSLKNETKNKAKFYKLNIEKYPGEYGEYDISGVPSVLIYKDGREVKRVLGVVPSSNLNMIINRVEL